MISDKSLEEREEEERKRKSRQFIDARLQMAARSSNGAVSLVQH